MNSFDPGFIEKQQIPQNLLRTIRLLGEYKGALPEKSLLCAPLMCLRG